MKKAVYLFGFSFLVLLSSLAAFYWLASVNGWLNDDIEQEGYAVFHSPDERFRLVVHKNSSFWPVLPGQSGDAPGYVVLKDRQGKELARADVNMVQNLYGSVHWYEERVRIKFVATWPLPPDSMPAAADSRTQ